MRILFQGDSITDGSRDKSDIHSLGWNYPLFAKRYIEEAHPEIDFEFINLGIAGNQTSDLVQRWTEDCIEYQPDILSILIGINDTWLNSDSGYLSNEKFEENYRNILERVKKETNAKIIILEQFLFPAEDKDHWRDDVNEKICITRKMAREYADYYIPLDGLFAAKLLYAPSLHWAHDGVHTSDAGNEYIGRLYADAVDALLKK